MSQIQERIAVAVFIVIFAALAGTSALRKSATIEEFAQIPAGLYSWDTYDFSLNPKTPPLGRLFATLPARLIGVQIEKDLDKYQQGPWRPWLYATEFMRNNQDRYQTILLVSRFTVILFGVLLCLVVWWIGREGFGEWGGILALACCALSPTLIAHSRFVTPEVIAALFSILVFITMIEYFEDPRSANAAKMAAALGISIATRFTCLIWAPFAFAAPIFAASTYLTESIKRPGPFRTALHLFIVIVLTWLIIIGGYFSTGVNLHRDLRLESPTMQAVAPVFRFIPLPRDFIIGLDKQLFDPELEQWDSGSYLLGEWYKGDRWNYYAFAAALKEPVSHIFAFLLASFLVLAFRPRDRDELILMASISIFFIFASLSGSPQEGIRYLLPIYPAAFIIIGRLAAIVFQPFPVQPTGADWKPIPIKTWRKVLREGQRIFLVLFCLWMFAQHAFIWPHYIPYFNLAAQRIDRREALLLDSNLDWGQDLPGLARWMKKNQIGTIDLAYYGHDDPARFDISYNLPARGSENQLIAISANLLMGKKYPMTFAQEDVGPDDPLWQEVERYRFETPIANIGHSILVFYKMP